MALFGGNKIQIDEELMERVRAHVAEAGFSSVEEFVQFCIEKELKSRRAAEEAVLADRLKGLGYLE